MQFLQKAQIPKMVPLVYEMQIQTISRLLHRWTVFLKHKPLLNCFVEEWFYLQALVDKRYRDDRSEWI